MFFRFRFLPVNFTLSVLDKPLKNVDFQQKTGQLIGSIECIDEVMCETSVVLHRLDSLEKKYEVTQGRIIHLFFT